MSANVQIFTPEDAKNTQGIALIDFWATWCGPCRMLAPVIEELAQVYASRVTFGKVNIDDYADYAISLGISAIPTLLVLKDGAEFTRMVGVQPKQSIEAVLKDALAAKER